MTGRLAAAFLTGVLTLAPATTRAGDPSAAGADSFAVRATSIDVDLHGNLYLVDAERGTITILDPAGTVLASMGGVGWENTRLDNPRAIWARNGIDVFVADYGNHRVQRFDRRLNYISTLSTRESEIPEQRFGYPAGIAVSRLGELFVCDGENQRLIRVGRDGTTIRSIGDYGAGRGRLTAPARVDVGAQDRVYVADGGRIVVFDLFGNYLHDLPLGVPPETFRADERGLLVAAGGRLYGFDADERPCAVVELKDLVGDRPLLAVAAGGGNLYLLVRGAVLIRPDPRAVP